MQPNEKHIELADRIFDQCPSLHPDQVDGASFVSEAAPIIEMALAAAREEGRRDMQDACCDLIESYARSRIPPRHAAALIHGRYEGEQAACDFLYGQIRNLPTNAPEGESPTKAKKEIK